MKPIIRSLNLIGQTINSLKVLSVDHITPTGLYYMLCECTLCGTKKVISAAHIKHNRIKSCGCLRVEKSRERQTKIEVSEYANIFRRWESGETQTEIAKDYGVTRQAIQLICKKINNGEVKI